MERRGHFTQSLSSSVFRPLSAGSVAAVAGSIGLALLAGILIAQQQASLLLLLALLLVTLWVLVDPRIAVAFFYVSVFLPFEYLQRYFISLPTIVLWLPFILLLLALVSLGLSKRLRIVASLRESLPLSFIRVGVVWGAVALISLVTNMGSLMAAVLSLRTLFLVYGSVVLHRLHFSSRDQERLLRVIVWTGVLMFPVTLVQRFVVVPLTGNNDMVTGLFASYSGLLFFQLFCLLVVSDWWLHGRRMLPFPPALTIALLFASLAVSNSKAAPLYFVLVMGALLWLCRSRLSKRMLAVLLVLTLVVIAGTLVFDRIFQLGYGWNESVVETFYTPDAVVNYLFYGKSTAGGGLQRGNALLFVYDLIRKKPINLLLGFGPGALSDSRVAGASGHIYAQYPALRLNNNTLSTTLGELGCAGILLIGGLLLAFYTLRDRRESAPLIVLRKSTMVLFASQLIYAPVLLFPEVALILGVINIQPKDNGVANGLK